MDADTNCNIRCELTIGTSYSSVCVCVCVFLFVGAAANCVECWCVAFDIVVPVVYVGCNSATTR